MKLTDIAKQITDLKVVRDGNFNCVYLAGRNCNKDRENISFVDSGKYVETAVRDGVDCIICKPETADYVVSNFGGGVCVSPDPKKTLFEIHGIIAEKTRNDRETSIGKNAQIHPTAVIDKNNVTIGNNVVIGANTTIKSGTVIGNNVVIMDNCVIGTPAFYYYGEGDEKRLVASNGGVSIEDNVVLHNSVIVEKGVIGGNSVVGRNTKIDQCTVIGHDTHIGSDCIVALNGMFAGWTSIGDNSFIGISVSTVPAVAIGKNCKISVGSVVTRDVEDGAQVSGNFAVEHSKFIDNLKMISK